MNDSGERASAFVEIRIAACDARTIARLRRDLGALAPGGAVVEERRTGFWMDGSANRATERRFDLILYVESSGAEAVARAARSAVASVVPPLFVTMKPLADVDWLEAWKARHRRTKPGRLLVVHPPWDAELAPDEVGVVLLPSDAFGSGDHPSTRTVLALLETVPCRGASVLDVGSGSGILGVAALKLGAATLVACDIESKSCAATIATATTNGVADRVRVFRGSVDAIGGVFDLVLANIHAEILFGLLPDLARTARPGTTLVLGGLREAFVAAAEKRFLDLGLAEVTRNLSDGFAAFHLRA